MGFLLGGSCSPCCGGEGYAVKFEGLPHQNVVFASTSGSSYCTSFDGESYLDSKNGTFRVARYSPDSEKEAVLYSYADRDAAESDKSGGRVCGPSVLVVRVLFKWNTRYNPARPEYVRVELEANGGTIVWQKSLTSFAVPIVLSVADVTTNWSQMGSWDLSSTTATIVADSASALPACAGDGNFSTLSRIQHVAAATVRPGYCVGSETAFTVFPAGVSDANYAVRYYNAGSDELSVDVSDYLESSTSASGTAEMKVLCKGTHTLGWGGRFNTDTITAGGARADTAALHGWVTAFPCSMEWSTPFGSGTLAGVCLIQASLKKKYLIKIDPSFFTWTEKVYSGRRLALGIMFLAYEPPFTALRSCLNRAYVSNGSPGEDGYAYGAMPSFSGGDVKDEIERAIEKKIVYAPDTRGFNFTLSQN